MQSISRKLILLLFLVSAAAPLAAQRGMGFRFATGFNHFYRAEEYPLIDGSWSNVVLGVYYQEYFSNGGVQAGLNFIAKNNTNRGFPNLPLVMKDFNGNHNVGVTAVELDLKVGPRFGPVNPKIGYMMGYWFKRDGFLEDTTSLKLNKYYIALPFAISAQLPTGYGSVGFGISYDVGLTNILRNPDPKVFQDFNGSRIRTFRVEITVLFGFKRQKPKEEVKPPPPPEVGE